MRLIVMMGSTCAGKTEHGKRIACSFGFRYISSGAIARSMMDDATAKNFTQGQLSPYDKEIVGTIHEELQCELIGTVLDGFPRTKEHYETLKKWVDPWMKTKMRSVAPIIVQLDIPSSILWRRAKERARDVFDTRAAAKKRDELYRETTLPIIQDAVDAGWSLVRLVIEKELPIDEVQKELLHELYEFGVRLRQPVGKNVARYI